MARRRSSSAASVTPAADVTWYVDTSFTVRGLRAGTDYSFRVIAENGASHPLTLDRSFVPRTSYDKPSAPRGPLEVSDVTIVDGEKAVLECRVAVTPAAEVTWYSPFATCLQRHFRFVSAQDI